MDFEVMKKFIICTPERYLINKEEYSKTHYTNIQIFNAVMVNKKSISEIDLFYKQKFSYNNLYCPKTFHNILFNKRDLDSEINTLSSIGCALSHISLWHKCIELNEKILIMEDDVYITDITTTNMDKIINNYMEFENPSILYLCSLAQAHKLNSKFNVKGFDYNSDLYTYNYTINPFTCGTQAYIINPSAAKLLIETCFPIQFHIDYYLMMISRTKNINLQFINHKFSPFYFANKEKLSAIANWQNYSKPLLES
jgi:GR25 family glycosyltransferase involved in LPS biosynthesis